MSSRTMNLQKLINEPSLPTLSLPEIADRKSLAETGSNPYFEVLKIVYGDEHHMKIRVLSARVIACGKADMLLLCAAIRLALPRGYNAFETEPVVKYLEDLVKKKMIKQLMFGRSGSPILSLQKAFDAPRMSSKFLDQVEKRMKKFGASNMKYSDAALLTVWWD